MNSGKDKKNAYDSASKESKLCNLKQYIEKKLDHIGCKSKQSVSIIS
jgi:hypothetical protein